MSVVIPVKDGGKDLRRCLDGVARQRFDDDVEIVVVDSGSRDDSRDVARSFGARVHQIAPHEFNHGATRNLGVSLASGRYLVFTSQDAEPDGDDWLSRLVAPLREDETIAGVYGRQVPHADAKPPERFFLEFLYGPVPKVQRAARREELSMQTTLFSNANSVIRRDVLERFPFVEDIIMSEDQEWSKRVLLAGYAIYYEPLAVVRHSHPYTVRAAFRRFFDSGVSADRSYLAGARPSQMVLYREATRYAREELKYLVRTGNARWIPYAAIYELAKFAGLQLGGSHARLPRRLKVRFSATPSYWG
ncbi:MAG TPA: glycosyltransferase [Solirubrobacteraceae bacterium]|nr:glycosyltransferase [Solirubrobacteraceae bacterium]